jgi:hypothetical protein
VEKALIPEKIKQDMKNIIRLEELAMFLLSILMFAESGFEWWWFPALLLLPDISMIGYVIDNQVGAYCYNLFHHKGIAILIFAMGFLSAEPILVLMGAILFGHSSMDRILGYGLKFTDSFKNTHLGPIGKK